MHADTNLLYLLYFLSLIKCRFSRLHTLTAQDIQTTHLHLGESLDWWQHCLVWNWPLHVAPRTLWKGLSSSFPEIIKCCVSKLDAACSCLLASSFCDALCKRTSWKKRGKRFNKSNWTELSVYRTVWIFILWMSCDFWTNSKFTTISGRLKWTCTSATVSKLDPCSVITWVSVIEKIAHWLSCPSGKAV